MDCGKYYNQVGEFGLKPEDLERFRQTSRHLLDSGSLLDIGCGEGYWLKFLSETTDLQLSGSDVSQIRLNLSRKNLNNENISLSVDDITELPYENKEFDQITALEVIEHIPEWQKGLAELVRVASKRVVITVPYNQELIYEICPDCGGKAYVDGHINSFTKKDFQNIIINGKVSFKGLKYPLNYYTKKALKEIIVKTKKEAEIGNEEDCTPIICPDCYKDIPSTRYAKFSKRALSRLSKIIKHYPEFLLVQIDK
ncbi:hypothetical protein CL621_02030 [archaeon]|nr:hypothetical protein [archaeon]|tara:strand:+ start:1401 stop:2162 length:762 start_codon:yes stop_codon:yes gene_type:complete